MPELDPTEPITITIDEAPSEEAPVVIETGDPQDAMAIIKKQLEDSQAETKAERDRAAIAESARQEESRRRMDAENRARGSDAQAGVEAAAAREREFESVSNALNAANAKAEQLASQKAALMAEGKWDEAARLDVQIARVGGDLSNLERGKSQLEAQRKETPPPPPPARKTDADSREEFLNSIPAESAAWVRKHADKYFGDASFRGKVNAAADYLEKVRGITFKDPTYYTRIEEEVGLRTPAPPAKVEEPAPEPVSVAAKVTQRAALAPAAPPSRTVLTARPGVGTKVTLTPEQRAVARATMTKDTSDAVAKGMDPEEAYARQLKAILDENDGRMPFTNSGRA